MISINTEKCIGCGRCAEDCFPSHIEIVDGKAHTNDKACMECGHCIAVCPMNAVTLPGYDMDEVKELNTLDYHIEPSVYLNHLKTRRSIRHFNAEPVSEEHVKLLIEAGRYSPTGGNLQNVSYYVSHNNISELRIGILKKLKELGDEAERTGNKISFYSDMWLKMYEDYMCDGTDKLFFNSGTVIVISSDSPQSACIAAAHIETMTYSLGLGMLYSGFSARAINNSPELKSFINLKDGYSVYAVLVLGHPDVKYLRTVPRKAADVSWN